MLNAINSIGAIFQNWWALPVLFGSALIFGLILKAWYNSYLKKKALEASDKASVDANQKMNDLNKLMNDRSQEGIKKVLEWLEQHRKK